MSLSGRVCLVVLAALAAIASTSAARAAARQAGAAGERMAGLLVEFAAVLSDGTPVADLQASEVEVRLNGRVRNVRSVRRVATAPATAASGAAIHVPPPYGTNAGAAAGRSFALVVDQESFIGGREQPLRNAVEGLEAELTPADRMMVVALPYGGVRVPFTGDQALIRQAMTGLSGQGTRNESGSELAFRTRRFLEALYGFLETQAGRSTPLTVLLFTAGLAAPRRDAPMALAPGMNELRVDHFQHVTASAGAACALFYMIQPADVEMRAGGYNESIGGVGFTGSDNPMEGIEHLAGATGAARLPLDATGSGSLLRVARETSAYYVAEVEPERREVFGRSRPVAVRVGRPGVTVRTNPEITFVEPARRAGSAKLTVTGLLASAEAFTDVPLRVAGFTVRAAGGQLRAVVVVEPVDPAASLTSVGAILVDGAGRVVANWSAKDATARPLLGAMAVPGGTYRLRVAAVDSAGRPGAAEDVVEARLTSVGPLSLGPLMLGVSSGGGMRLQLEFGAEPTVIASFDIYGGVAGMGLSATLELARDPDGPPLVSSPLSLARVDEARMVATGAVPIGSLPPGDYVVRGIVRLEDGTTGRVIRTLRKVAR
jgi:hypothetical protein